MFMLRTIPKINRPTLVWNGISWSRFLPELFSSYQQAYQVWWEQRKKYREIEIIES